MADRSPTGFLVRGGVERPVEGHLVLGRALTPEADRLEEVRNGNRADQAQQERQDGRRMRGTGGERRPATERSEC